MTNVRGLGLMCAFDLPSKPFRDAVLKRCYDAGVIILGCGTQAIRFRSPLTITADEIDGGLDVLAEAVGAVTREHGPADPVMEK